MKRKRILHLIDQMGMGGAQIIIKGIMERNKNNDHVMVFVLRKDRIHTQIDNPNVYIYDSYSRYFSFPFFAILKLIKQYNIQIIHCHLFRSQFFGGVLKWLKKDLLFLFHEHGRLLQLDQNKKINPETVLYKYTLKWIKNRVDLFICVSEIIQKKLIETFTIHEQKTKVLYNFVDLDTFYVNKSIDRAEEKEKLGFNHNNYLVGFAARFISMKGWKDFITSASMLVKTIPDITFLVAGDGPDKTEMQRFAEKLGLSDYIKYPGYVDDMNWFYNIIDCFVITSHWEAMGLTALEAQACGVPVVSSDTPALNEILTDKLNCLLFKAKDAHHLKEKIEWIYRNEKLKERLIDNGLKNVKAYRLDHYLNALDEIYGNLL